MPLLIRNKWRGAKIGSVVLKKAGCQLFSFLLTLSNIAYLCKRLFPLFHQSSLFSMKDVILFNVIHDIWVLQVSNL